MGDGKGKTALR